MMTTLMGIWVTMSVQVRVQTRVNKRMSMRRNTENGDQEKDNYGGELDDDRAPSHHQTTM